jgi:hypothetical protein
MSTSGKYIKVADEDLARAADRAADQRRPRLKVVKQPAAHPNGFSPMFPAPEAVVLLPRRQMDDGLNWIAVPI